MTRKSKHSHLLERFIHNANKSIPHPIDDKRFINFISHCHRHSVDLDELKLYKILQKNGFAEPVLGQLVSKYTFGRELLRYYRGIHTSSENEHVLDEINATRKELGFTPLPTRKRGRPKRK